MAGKSLPELQAIAKQNSSAFRQLFGTGKEGAQSVLNNINNVKVPKGLSKEAALPIAQQLESLLKLF